MDGTCSTARQKSASQKRRRVEYTVDKREGEEKKRISNGKNSCSNRESLSLGNKNLSRSIK